MSNIRARFSPPHRQPWRFQFPNGTDTLTLLAAATTEQKAIIALFSSRSPYTQPLYLPELGRLAEPPVPLNQLQLTHVVVREDLHGDPGSHYFELKGLLPPTHPDRAAVRGPVSLRISAGVEANDDELPFNA